MKNRFDNTIILGIVIAWLQLLAGCTAWAFYTLGVMIAVILLQIKEYLK